MVNNNMITKNLTIAMAFFGAIIFPPSTCDISGKWSGPFAGLDGNSYNLSYEFKVSGNKLSGNATWPEGTVSIDSGTILDSSIRFNLNFDGEIIPHSGYCYKDSISMNIILNSTPMHFTLKKNW